MSLAKTRPVLIRSEELALVEAAVAKHPKACNYRVDVKGERIVVYERGGQIPDEVAARMARFMGLSMKHVLADKRREALDRTARFTPVLRFTLADEAQPHSMSSAGATWEVSTIG